MQLKVSDILQQVGHPAGRHGTHVEGPVGLFPVVNVVGLIAGKTQVLQLNNLFLREIGDGMQQGQGLQRHPHQLHLALRGLVQRRDANPRMRFADDQALGYEAQKGLAHRHMADLELFRDMVLPKSSFRGQFPTHDTKRKGVGDTV